jgi:hypothetical protein
MVDIFKMQMQGLWEERSRKMHELRQRNCLTAPHLVLLRTMHQPDLLGSFRQAHISALGLGRVKS